MQHDLFITASIDDPCSNSLIEAMHCGLPSLVRNSGGHPEIVGEGGLLFNGIEDVHDRLDDLADQKESLRKKFALPTINEVGDRYLQFAREQWSKKLNRNVTISDLSKVTKNVASMWVQPRIKRLLGSIQP